MQSRLRNVGNPKLSYVNMSRMTNGSNPVSPTKKMKELGLNGLAPFFIGLNWG